MKSLWKIDFPSGLDGIESDYNAGDPDSIPGEGNGYPLQYSCQENSLNREVWWAKVHGAAKNGT